MTKYELIKAIKNLIECDTTPDPEEVSDGQLLDIIYELVSREENK